MSDHKGQIVRATAGRDKEDIFCVMGVEKETGRLLLADGKRRRAAHPKAKKPRHVETLTQPDRPFDHPAIQKLKQGEPVSDRELRRALAAFKENWRESSPSPFPIPRSTWTLAMATLSWPIFPGSCG